MTDLLSIIIAQDDAVRDRSLDAACGQADLDELLRQASRLDRFWRESDNLYHRVRALFFLSAIYRYQVPPRLPSDNQGRVPYEAFQHLLRRRHVEAINLFCARQAALGPSDALASGLAHAYREHAFQTLADQVRQSVRTVAGNRWMFRLGHTDDHPLRLRRELLQADARGLFPILLERTPVRMDFTHSAWSDIFFLGMDYPEGARVLNVSVDLGVHGRDPRAVPPIETYLRVIDQPVLRLTSVDLKTQSDVVNLSDVFDFARDYLGLLKAAVIAAGLVPPGLEGLEQPVSDVLDRLVGPGLGLELVSKVNDIPKGSRLAVSTNLLGSLISICMRATGQFRSLSGPLAEPERRLVAARAILGEWLGGSGGGWQDSGGVWPGIKLICGASSGEGDAEYGVSRGRLLPNHTILNEEAVSTATRDKLQQSLVLVHGGMAQNVGPILEMVTEKYLLRSPAEWRARQDAVAILDEVVDSLRQGDIRRVGEITTRNFSGPLQTVIPWATNLFTETLIEQSRQKFGDSFWGFWMLGGMSGGGMGFIFEPSVKPRAQAWLQETMAELKSRFQTALPFAMQPVVYDFAVNDVGTCAELCDVEQGMPEAYYCLVAPQWLRNEQILTRGGRAELQWLGSRCRQGTEFGNRLLSHLIPEAEQAKGEEADLEMLLRQNGFDAKQHEQIREELRAGRIGLAQNRLPVNAVIEDVRAEDAIDIRRGVDRTVRDLGEQALAAGEVAVLTLSAGAGSRWTEGAGVTKALHPFCRLAGRHRNFLETHLAKSRRTGRDFGRAPPHIFTTGYLTQASIAGHLRERDNYDYPGRVILSPGRSVGLRLVPMVRDLRFAWETMPQQTLDEQQEKLRASLRAALIQWAQQMGEGSDYTDNLPLQCLHPVGHWYEVPNLLRNGVLRELLQAEPQLKYLLLHNVDTLGAHLDPAPLGVHISSGNVLTYEVIPRRLEDTGGGLARVDGHLRLLEGLAMPREEDEFRLSYYNSMTTWISIDGLLETFGLVRSDLLNGPQVESAVREIAHRMPTYITLKDVKKRWGHGQEDIFPVSQFEKLWGDMTTLPNVTCGFTVVPLMRGQQLKQQAQLDGWLRDGSATAVQELCQWE